MKVSIPGRDKRLIFTLPHNIQNITWVPPSLIINRYWGVVSLGSRSWVMKLTTHFHLVWMSGDIPVLPMHKESFTFMMCWISDYPLCAKKIIFLKRKYLFSVLYYARKYSCGNGFIYVYHICILSCDTMHGEIVTFKLTLFFNLKKIIINALHAYTIHTTRSVTLPNLILPPNSPFSLLQFDLSTECSQCHRVIWCFWESTDGLPCWVLLVGTGLLLGWLNPFRSIGPKPPTPSSPTKPEHCIVKTSLPSVSPKDRNKTHVQNTWVHKCRSIKRWTGLCLGAFSWGIALEVGRLQVWFSMVSKEFFIDINLLAALWPWRWLRL